MPSLDPVQSKKTRQLSVGMTEDIYETYERLARSLGYNPTEMTRYLIVSFILNQRSGNLAQAMSTLDVPKKFFNVKTYQHEVPHVLEAPKQAKPSKADFKRMRQERKLRKVEIEKYKGIPDAYRIEQEKLPTESQNDKKQDESPTSTSDPNPATLPETPKTL